jgi:hypothetical protein
MFVYRFYLVVISCVPKYLFRPQPSISLYPHNFSIFACRVKVKVLYTVLFTQNGLLRTPTTVLLYLNNFTHLSVYSPPEG